MNIIEYWRKESIKELDSTSFKQCFPIWLEYINKVAPNRTEMQLFNLGDHLKYIFNTTNPKNKNTEDDRPIAGRTQSEVAAGGAGWEALVCWYLNLCTMGRRTVVVKHKKELLPTPVSDSFTVNYGSFRSNTESDIIAITFPDREEYKMDMNNIHIKDVNSNDVDLYSNNKYNLLPVLNALIHRDFSQIEICIIQTKTNWNDNAQIPMLWDAVYYAKSFSNNITVGTNGYSIHNIKRFKYCFVTVPTNKISKFKPDSTPVMRVSNLSGGNYWGLETKQGIANSVKELLERNLKNGSSESILTTIRKAVPELSTTYSYFGL